MRCLVVGLGSMGRRRVANLVQLRAGEVRGFDARADRREEVTRRFSISCFERFEDGMVWNPDLLAICTPPDDHLPFACAAAREKKHFFTELSINPDGLEDLCRLVDAQGIVAAPSCTARFNPMIMLIRSLITDGTLGRPSNLIAYLGQYLPHWHPWEDYRQFFAARKRTGACRELLAFDMLWLPWALGPVAAISCMRERLGSLDADIDDVYQVLVRFQLGTLAAIQVDAISRIPVRYYRFVSELGVIVWDWTSLYLRVYTASDGKWKEHAAVQGFAGYSVEEVYLEEMRAFLAAVQGERPYPYSLQEDLERVNLLAAIEQSADERVQMLLDANA